MATVVSLENGAIVPRCGKAAEAEWPPKGGGGGDGGGGGETGAEHESGGSDTKPPVDDDSPPPPPRDPTPPPAPDQVPRPVTPPPPPPPPSDHENHPPPPVYASLAAMSTMEEESVRERVRSALLKECSMLLINMGSTSTAVPGTPTQLSPTPGDTASSGRLSKDSFRRVFMQRELLERLFRLFDQDRDDLLIQEDWVEFLKARLTDEKQIDFAEQVESVAYVLCGTEPITLDKFCQIFNAKGILDKLFRLVDQDSDGVVTADQVMEFIANLSNARPRCGIDRASLEWLEKLFRDTVGDQREIRRDDFRKIVISKNPFFTERVFQIFDRDNSGSISLQEFIDAMHQFAGQSPDDKIRFLFKVYDIDGDGLIQHRELQHVMRACMEENGMRFSEEQIEDLTGALFEDADTQNRGAITYEALKAQLEKHDGLLENLSISIDRWLVPPKPKPTQQSLKGRLLALRPYQMSLPYLRNNQAFLSCLTFILALNAALFIVRVYEYWNKGTYILLARACGQCLNLDCSLVLALVLRRCLTFLRAHGLSHFLPLDHHIYFHKLVGILICGFSLLHTIAHILNFSLVVVNHPELNKANWTTWEWLGTDKPGLFGLIPGWANPTGIALVIILIVMFICSQPFVRRGGCFEIFYWTHLLYVPFWILLVIHAPNFWKWFIGPCILYILERVWRLVNQRARRLGRTYISSGVLLPSRVVHLVIRRPLHFDFCPGDYVFVNVPAVARYEWHPFTISSAPEQQDSLWLHVRAVGQWTNRLYDYFEREQERLQAEEAASTSPTVVPVEVEGGAISGLARERGDAAERTPSMSYNGNSMMRNKGLKRLQASIQRKLGSTAGDEGSVRSGSIKSVGFRRVGGDGFVNEGFVCGGSDGRDAESVGLATLVQGTILDSVGHGAGGEGNGDSTRLTPAGVGVGGSAGVPGVVRGRKPTPDQKLHRLLLAGSKIPLAKSLSMPDMQNRTKKRERLMALREYMRSESERSFDEAQVRRARMQSLGLAYLSPQNKCVAQSFRYMRHKPTIIAFKTPSQEEAIAGNTSPGVTSASVKSRRKSPASAGLLFPRRTSGGGGCPEAVVEEGGGGLVRSNTTPIPSSSPAPPSLLNKMDYDDLPSQFGGRQMAVGYPIGKPLEGYPLPGPQNDVVGAFLSDQWLPCGRRLPITFLCNTTCCRFKRDFNAIRAKKCQGLPTAYQRPATGEDCQEGPLSTHAKLSVGTKISVDGPYGAPSSHIFRAQHAVLIGTGIGVTPFASILQSIMHRYWKARHCCPRCKFAWASEIPQTVMHLRKVDFFWINRDQRSFEWFVNLLSQLEMEQAELGGAMERFLDMHMYITSALQKTDMKAVGLQLALDLLHQKEKRDLITGLKTRTNAGRPNWEKVFQQISDQGKGKVTVFYCGPPQLGKILRVKCDQFGFIFRKEVF